MGGGRARVLVATVVALAVVCGFPRATLASGHGPLFGAATPVLGKGGWSFDAALMGRGGEDAVAQTVRSMISFGVRQDLQISASIPFDIGTHPPLPGARMMSMMSSHRDVEMLAGWRVHSRPIAVGARIESTIFAGWTQPLPGNARGHGGTLTPSLSISAVTGLASRAHYLWVGGGYQRYLVREGARPSNVASYSLVYGYRPPAWRLEYPKPDVRLFAEIVGERIGHARHAGADDRFSGGTTVFAGPTVLALYKAYAFEAGLLFPVHRRMRAGESTERFRFGINVACFFWP